MNAPTLISNHFDAAYNLAIHKANGSWNVAADAIQATLDADEALRSYITKLEAANEALRKLIEIERGTLSDRNKP